MLCRKTVSPYQDISFINFINTLLEHFPGTYSNEIAMDVHSLTVDRTILKTSFIFADHSYEFHLLT